MSEEIKTEQEIRLQTQILRLFRVMQKLRTPDGCAWDRKQTLQSLKPYLIEEAYEVLEAIEQNDSVAHLEELGDLLLQVVFQSVIQDEMKNFDFPRVAESISDKLERRHPHVFGDRRIEDSEQIAAQWEQLKKQEKQKKATESQNQGALSGVPRALPGLVRACRVGEKASYSGFDFTNKSQALEKVKEEVSEVEQAIIKDQDVSFLQEEIGDLLFSVVNLSRLLKIDPEEALRLAIDKFMRRFSYIEKQTQDTLKSLSFEDKEKLWLMAKKQV